jgi:hypothetical protein
VLRTMTLATTAVLASGGSPQLVSLPGHLAQGARTTISASHAKGCRIVVIYWDGRVQDLGYSGTGRWRWIVAADAPTGRANVLMPCRNGPGTRGSVEIVRGGSKGELEIVKSGFSERGADLSYGALVRNTSTQTDALGVRLLVNLVGASNRLLGTRTASIPLIPAGGTYALGGLLAAPAGARVTRLEIVVQGGERRAAAETLTTLANIRVVPSADDPGFLGSVDGEVGNGDPYRLLQRATFSAVILDPSGNVVGGATGVLADSLPGGAREYFSLRSGLQAVPVAKAGSALVSVTPTFVG